MCGLFGWQLSPEAMNEGDVSVLATILAAHSDHRGNESWGVVMVTPGEVPTVIKNTGSIKKTCRIKNIIAPQVIGHTRKATTGAISVKNAHPFLHDKIVGAHNGFIFDHTALNTEYNREFEVDSQHLIAHIAEGKPLEDLSGMGTVSYLNLDNPNVVLLGRGASSDLAIYGIGEDITKPIGIVWCSIGYWAKEALEMAGFSNIFNVNTNIRKLYKVDKYDIIEVGEFPLGQGRSRTSLITNADNREIGCRSSGVHNHGYRGRTYFDEKSYDKDKDSGLRPLSSLNASELDPLPKSLKKNPQISNVARGETEKAIEAVIQCDGCSDWGPLVANFSSDAEGILYHGSIDENLCFTCTVHWGHWSQGMINLNKETVKVEVPKLSIVPGSTIEYK